MTTSEIKNLVASAAAEIGFPVSVALAQIQAESGFNPRARSSANAQGLAQFIPGTWRRYGNNGNPYDPVDSMRAWQRYMADLGRIFPGRIDLQLAAYNWGENRKALKEALATGIPFLELPANRVPAETRNYVRKILNNSGAQDFTTTNQNPLRVINQGGEESWIVWAILGAGALLLLL